MLFPMYCHRTLPVRSRKKCGGVSHAVARQIENAVLLDDRGFRIVQDRELQAQTINRKCSAGKIVGADGQDIRLQTLDQIVILLQLHQLRSAIDSPEGSVKNQDDVAPLQVFLQRNLIALGARQDKTACATGRLIGIHCGCWRADSRRGRIWFGRLSRPNGDGHRRGNRSGFPRRLLLPQFGLLVLLETQGTRRNRSCCRLLSRRWDYRDGHGCNGGWCRKSSRGGINCSRDGGDWLGGRDHRYRCCLSD